MPLPVCQIRKGNWSLNLPSKISSAAATINLALSAGNNPNSALAKAAAGLGIAQIPAFVLKEAMERHTLELVLGDWFPEPAPLYVVYPQNRHLSSKVRVFVDWVAALLSEHDGIQLRSTLHPKLSAL